MTQTIDYKVKNHTKFLHSKGYKQISKINEKMQSFRFPAEQDKFELQLNFTCPAIINAIQVKARFTREIVFQLYNNKEMKTSQRLQYEESQIKSVDKLRVIRLNQSAQLFDKAIVRFLNYPFPLQTEITYILFKGFKQEQTKKIQKVKNVSQTDTFQPGTKRKINDSDRGVFSARNKQKANVTSKEDLLQQVVADKRNQRKKTQKQHEQELKRVLQISKKQYERSERKKDGGNEKPEIILQQDQPRSREQINLMQQQQNGFFDYQVVDYDKIKKVFQHVTPQWVEAQRKAQQQRSIQPRHSLANRIKIKVFGKMDFCLNNIHGVQKNRLLKLIEQLGGKIIQEPKDECIIVTNKMQGGKINLGKTMHRVKFVRPEYIDQCDKMKAKLDEKDYMVKS